ncbi:MAG: hypothetical protein H7831_15185 [Magnetococcus sp. WYHC-3]
MELIQLNDELLRQIDTEWRREIELYEADVFPNYYRMVLDWARKFVAGQADQGNFAYVLTKEASDKSRTVLAILDIMHVSPRSNAPWIKLLKVYLRPSLDAALEPPPETLEEVAAFAILKTVALATTNNHSADLVKVASNGQMDRKFFLEFSKNKDLANHFAVSVRGGWLEIAGRDSP